MHALVRARIPYLPVHVDDIDEMSARLRLLILPNVGALSDAQAASIRRFAERGGSLVATGDTSRYDEWGDLRGGFALGDLFGCQFVGDSRANPSGGATRDQGGVFAPASSSHSYLRLLPEQRGRIDGPHRQDDPKGGDRHPVLRGFDGTDVIAFGGSLQPVLPAQGTVVPLTLVPAFPTYPPETAWMREPKTDTPGLVLSERGTSRVAYMPADVDRRYAREHLPDHARLLGNVVRWAAGGEPPLSVEGTGLIDCHVYEQPVRRIVHLVNLTSEATWQAPLDELIRVGPFTVTLRLPDDLRRAPVRLLVSGRTPRVTLREGAAAFEIELDSRSRSDRHRVSSPALCLLPIPPRCCSSPRSASPSSCS